MVGVSISNNCKGDLKALPHVTISSTISSTFHRRRWNIVDIVDDEPATRNDNVNDAEVK